jgi:hypothetical protein
MEGGFGVGAEPYHLPIKNSYNLVMGQIPGAVLTGDGGLLGRDTPNWGPWSPPVGNPDDGIAVLQRTTALRRGPGRDWLVFGRMLRPADVRGIEMVRWSEGNRPHEVPAVFHAAWQAPDGRPAVVLANWTRHPQEVEIHDVRLGSAVRITIAADRVESHERTTANGAFAITLPPLASALIARK